MSSELKNCLWGEIATLEYGKSLRDYSDVKEGIPVYGTNGPIGYTEKSLSDKPGVIIGRKGAYRGVHYSPGPFFVIDTAFYLKPKIDDLDIKYAYYQLLTQDINIMDSGSAIPSTSRDDFYGLELSLPSLSTQRRIASILTALDDKIELNRQMNETLEGIAQALWGEWFGKYASGEEGNLCTLGEFITIKHGFAFKGENISDINGDNILVTPGNFSVGGGFNEKKLRYFEGDEFPKEYILNAKDLILTMTDLSRDGDTLGYPAFVPEMHGKKLLHNQRIGLVQFRNARLGKYFLYGLMKTNEYRSFILGGATGSTVRHTSPGRICDFKFPEQDKEKITEFELVADGLHNLVELNLQQSRTLTALRDALLPRLMRGEVMF